MYAGKVNSKPKVVHLFLLTFQPLLTMLLLRSLTTFRIIRNDLSVRRCICSKPCLEHPLSKLISGLDNQTKFVFLGGHNMVAQTQCIAHKILHKQYHHGPIGHKCKFPTLQYAEFRCNRMGCFYTLCGSICVVPLGE